MGMFHCEVTKILEILPHENADNLEIAKVWDYPVVIRKGSYKVGDLVSYICLEAIPGSHPIFSFLGKDALKHIKAKKLRGVFSQGLLVDAPEGFKEGDSVVEYYGITKWEAPEEREGYRPKDGLLSNGINGQNESNPKGWTLPKYDLESLRKYSSWFKDKQVVVTTKIEGENCTHVFMDGKLWVKSRNWYKRNADNSKWWEYANANNVEEKLSKFPGKAFISEYYGNVSGFRYDCPIVNGKVVRKIRVFDVYDVTTGLYLPHDEAMDLAKQAGFEVVPELYRGIFDKDLIYPIADQDETLGTTHEQMKEGIVVKAINTDERIIAKLKGQRYSLWK